MLILASLLASGVGVVAPPVVTVTKDDTVINQSCTVVIAPGTVIADTNGNGVIQVTADNVTIQFADGSVLRGADPKADPDGYTGIGIRIDGRKRVTLKDVRVSGFKVGVVATGTPNFTVENADLSDNFRQRLRSNATAEDSSDWLFPHDNDKGEWLDRYGAALAVKNSSQVTIKGVRVRRGQNGIVLDRVDTSRIFDNDCSFISGWGIAMWRSSRNIITRNALDFCVRGHVEGVYNRGQDSAGLLMFEQCSGNTIAENSITHGGDGIFGFAGKEAIGDSPAPPGFDHRRKGNNDNIIAGNDLSYAPAHGLEMTFSFGNKILKNRFTENAICGIWGGYSQDTVIFDNVFERNGGMAYGLERGGINMEHASGNRILQNTFLNNRACIHLWWDDDGALAEKPGVKKNYKGVSGNIIANNVFEFDDKQPFKLRPDEKLIALQIRDAGRKDPANAADGPPDAKQPAKGRPARGNEHVKDNVYVTNYPRLNNPAAVEFAVDPGLEPTMTGSVPAFTPPRFEVLGETRPVGARKELEGRDKIIVGEWGPWDHQSPLVRMAEAAGQMQVYEVLGAGTQQVTAKIEGRGVQARVDPARGTGPARVAVMGVQGITPYTLVIGIGQEERKVQGLMVLARWEIKFFPWTEETDPRKNLEGWRKLAVSPEAVSAQAPALNFNYGGGGPKSMKLGPAVAASSLGNDHFGMIATTKLPIPKGRWKIRTLSDDGIRVTIDGKVVIEDWTWHAPKRDEAIIARDADGVAEIRVEHFEIDGAAAMVLEIADGN